MASYPARGRPSSTGLALGISSANLTQYTGGVAAQSVVDSTADLEEPSSAVLDMQFDTTSGNIPLAQTPNSRTFENFVSSSGDFNSSPLQIVTDGKQNIGVEHRTPLTLRSVISRSYPAPWTSLAATGAPAKPANQRTKGDSSAAPVNQAIDTSSDDSEQTSFLDSGIDVTQYSQHDTASQFSASVMDPAQYSFPNMLPSQPQDVVLEQQPDDPQTNLVNGSVQPQSSRRGQNRSHNPVNLTCGECGVTSKTPSDARKHSARHEGPHKCKYADCSRAVLGFATKNDRDRHAKSVHKENPRGSKSYKCFGNNCSKSVKIWPRLDNFKQHLSRMHGDESVDKLVQRSEFWYDHEGGDAIVESTQSALDSAQAARENRDSTVPRPAARATRPAVPRVRTATRAQLQQDHIFLSPNAAQQRPIRPEQTGTSQVLHGDSSQHRYRPYPAQRPTRQAPTTTQSEYNPQSQSGRATIQDQHLSTSTNALPPDWQNFVVSQHDLINQFNATENFDEQTYFQTYHVGMARTAPELNPNSLYDQMTFLRDTQPINPNQTNQELPDSAEVLAGMDDTDLPLDTSPGISLSTETPLTPISVPRVTVDEQEDEEVNNDKIVQKVSAASAEDIKAFLVGHLSKSKDVSMISSVSDASLPIKMLLKSLSSRGSRSLASISEVSYQKPDDQAAGHPTVRGRGVQCHICGKIKPRPSDLKKHLQRHEKLFGCVIDGCDKSFGSKNDWKRHEQTHPEQQECYRCAGTHHCNGAACFKVFYHGEASYRDHLKLCGVNNIDAMVLARKIPALNQGRFWCGFCNDIVDSKTYGHEALNVRLSHIDKHYRGGEKRNAKDWRELAGENLTKTDIQRKNMDKKFDLHSSQQKTAGFSSVASQSSHESAPVSYSSYDSSLPFTGSSAKRPRTNPEQFHSAQRQSQLLQRQVSHSNPQQQRPNTMHRPRSVSLVHQQHPMRRSASSASQMLLPAQPQDEKQIGFKQDLHARHGRSKQEQQQTQPVARDGSPPRSYNDQGQEIARFATCCQCRTSFELGLMRFCFTCNHTRCSDCKTTRLPQMDMDIDPFYWRDE